MKQPTTLRVAVLLAAASIITPPAFGGYYTEDLGGQPIGYFGNDDGFFGEYSLGFALNYFGATRTSFWLNNNGNISFDRGFSNYTPDPLNTTTVAPSIAPYWADVDTRPFNGGAVYFNTSTPNQIVITWDRVGYYDQNTDKLASFQLVLRGDNYSIPTGEGQIGFFYKEVQWETGDASGGSGGFGGVPATVGFGDGLSSINPGEVSLPGSQQNGISGLVAGQAFWFNLSDSGVVAGDSSDNPILPGDILPGGTLVFNNVPSGQWYDPPSTTAFRYDITSPGDVFSEILNFPPGFSNLMVTADNQNYGPFGPGDNFIFPGGGVTSFTVSGINPPVDAGVGTAFPLQIAFGDASASFTMSIPNATPTLPEAGTSGATIAVAVLGFLSWRKTRQRRES